MASLLRSFFRTASLPLFLLLPATSHAQEESVQATEIQIEGKVIAEGMPLVKASVIIYPDGEPPKTIYTGPEGDFTFWLNPEKEYLVLFTKKGYIAKRIFFNTRNIPDNMFISRSGLLVDLFHEMPEIDFSVLNNPIGMFYYFPEKNTIDYDKQYTDSIERILIELKKLVYQQPVVFPDTSAAKEKPASPPEANAVWQQNDSLRKARNKVNHSETSAPSKKENPQTGNAEKAIVKNQKKPKDTKPPANKQQVLEKMRAETRKREEADSLKKAAIIARLKDQNQPKSDTIVNIANVEDEELAKKLFNEKLTKEQRQQYEAMLIKKYPAGITREEKQYKHFLLIRVIKIENGKVDEFKKIVYAFGSFFKKNGSDITGERFDQETEASQYKSPQPK